MHILILTQWYPPEPVLLLQELAQSLQEQNHQVTVLTGFPNYPSGTLYPGYSLRPYQKEVIEGVEITRVILYPEHSSSGIKRALNYLSFALACLIFGAWNVPKPDVIFTYHPPLTVGLPTYVLSRLWNVPFVYQIQDLWPETLSATGMLHNKQILSLIGKVAKWLYSKADGILVISPGFRQNLISKGVPASKIDFVSNWVDTTVYYRAESDPELARELGMADHFNVMFAGNMGEAQGLETVIEAALLLKDMPNLQFVMVGDGIAESRLRQLVNQYQLANVRFLGRFQPQDMPRLYALADILLVHLKDNPLFHITIPHKTLAYLASGRPILAAVAGDVADMVSSIGAGVTCPPQDPQALAEAVRSLYEMPSETLRAMGEKGEEAAATRFSRTTLTHKIGEVLCRVVERRQ